MVDRPSNDAVAGKQWFCNASNGSECCISRNERFIWYTLEVDIQPAFEFVNSPTGKVPQVHGQGILWPLTANEEKRMT